MQIFENVDIAKVEKGYQKINLWLVVGLTLLGLLLTQVFLQFNFEIPLMISAIFFLVTGKFYGKAWKYFATNSPNVLGKFYLAGSMLRMFLAIIAILIGALVNRGESEKILTPVSVFVIYYIATMIFDSVYFFRIEKNNKNK